MENAMLPAGDISINTLHTGTGSKGIIFIHGNCMTANAWLPQLIDPELNSKYKMMAFDLPGHGKSGWYKHDFERYGPESIAELIPHILTHFEIEEFILTGISYGTNVIGEISTPLKGCNGIVLASPCIVDNENLPGEVITGGPYGYVVAMAEPSNEDLDAFIKMHFHNKSLAERYRQDFLRTDPMFRQQLGQYIVSQKWTDELTNIGQWKLPVAIVFGKDDSLLKIDYLDGYPNAWRRTSFKLETAGHFVNEEKSVEFNALLKEFSQDAFK